MKKYSTDFNYTLHQWRKPSDQVYSDLYFIIYRSDVSALNKNDSPIIIKKTSKHINL